MKFWINALIVASVSLLASSEAISQENFSRGARPAVIAWVSLKIDINPDVHRMSFTDRQTQDQRIADEVEKLLRPYIRNNSLIEPSVGRRILLNSVLVKASPATIRKLENDPRVLTVIPRE